MPGGVSHAGPRPAAAGRLRAGAAGRWRTPRNGRDALAAARAVAATSYLARGRARHHSDGGRGGCARPDLLGLPAGRGAAAGIPGDCLRDGGGRDTARPRRGCGRGPCAASALPSIPVRFRNGGPDVPLGTPVAAQLGPAVGAVPHGLLPPPPPPAAAAVAAFGYNPGALGAAGAHAPGAAMQLVPPEPGPPPQLAQARFPQQYMLLQAGGAPTPSQWRSAGRVCCMPRSMPRITRGAFRPPRARGHYRSRARRPSCRWAASAASTSTGNIRSPPAWPAQSRAQPPRSMRSRKNATARDQN